MLDWDLWRREWSPQTLMLMMAVVMTMITGLDRYQAPSRLPDQLPACRTQARTTYHSEGRSSPLSLFIPS